MKTVIRKRDRECRITIKIPKSKNYATYLKQYLEEAILQI